MGNTSANQDKTPAGDKDNGTSFYSILQKPWISLLPLVLTLVAFSWVLLAWNAKDYYDVTWPIGAMGNSTSHYLKNKNGSNKLYQSISVFESGSISLANFSEVHQVGIELEAESELQNGKAISTLWNELVDGISLVMDLIQEMSTKGNKKSKAVDYQTFISKIVRVLHMMTAHFEELEALIINTRRSKAVVQFALYSITKQLQFESEARGLTRWLVSHFRGDRAFLRRQAGIKLTRVALQRASEVSKYLSEIEKQVKYYKDNIIAIHDSMTLEQDAGCRKSRFPFCLVFLESIFNVELD
ncbi:hypothetical protein PSTG_02365 [Puccinia striiformis f. sp. tritici PST-78]|uniref:Uncharacterized protein n=1 Tax=Puccinia striiformis f. sp. tritici PST-78 TaxID=1165861 RepID=A0A0L0VZM2_9BASI|nr:hypothetical protein PSTG_02365 [Puccinia striiformis f. sp. tritici PST-78]